MANDNDDQVEPDEPDTGLRHQPSDASTDGVRIIGAEPAASDDHDSAPDDTGEPEASSRFNDDGPTWSAAGSVDEPTNEPGAGETALPHWSEPPTAEMAALGTNESDDDDDWSNFTGSQPRFRSENADWEESDWSDFESDSSDSSAEPRDVLPPVEVDDDEAFAAAVRRRRGGSRRPARTVPARAPEPEPAAASAGGRDLPTALATAGIVVVVALLAFNAGTLWTALLVGLIMALAVVEFSHGLHAGGFRPAVPLVLLASATLPVAAREYGLQAMLLFTVLVVVFSLLWFLWEITPGRPLAGVASTLLAFGYVGLLGGFGGLLLGATHGIGLLLGAVICTVSYDVVGFFVGSQFGKTPIAPRISPNKTVEGTLAGMVASVVLGLLVVGQIYPWNGSKGLVLGVLVAAGAFLGDLCESMLKRDLGVKDFGTLLPGHGGVLDRFDSMLFALPITFYLAVHLDIFV